MRGSWPFSFLVRALVALVLVLACVAVPAPVRGTAQIPAFAAAKRECIVYITRTGDRYHIGSCRYLRRSRIPLSRNEAIKAGYTPCKVCGGSDC